MSEPSDDDDDAKVREKLDVPATRKQEAVKTEEPPARTSALDINPPLTYPDDGPVSEMIRKVDKAIGLGEQIVLVGMLVVMILVAATDALYDKIANGHVEIKEHVIVFSTFGIAMIGTAFATQQGRNLAMDLISRRLAPRARLILKVILELFTIFILIIVMRAGFDNLDRQKDFSRIIAWMIPAGGGLIILHTLLHLAIDFDYLRRNVTPPERMRSGH